MNKKSKADENGFVYSTNPDFSFNYSGNGTKETLAANQQQLLIKLDTKRRAGKTVTLITGFAGTDEDLQKLGKNLKSVCGTGGSAKDNEIIIQGDQRDKLLQWLLKNNYTKSRKI